MLKLNNIEVVYDGVILVLKGVSIEVPAQAGTHLSTVRASEPWIPAFAGTRYSLHDTSAAWSRSAAYNPNH